jgi:hypothetical protein
VVFGTDDVRSTEGQPATVLTGFYDPAPDGPFAVHVDWGDGSSQDLSEPGMGPLSLTHTYVTMGPTVPDQNYSIFTVTLTVTDALGVVATGTKPVAVFDSAPVITVAPQTTLAEEEQSLVTLATFTDASAGPWSVSIGFGTSWELDETFQTPGPIQWQFGGKPGRYSVPILVVDVGGQASLATAQIVVENTAPVLSADRVPTTLKPGDDATASFGFADPGWGTSDETYSCTVDYGDGAGAQAGVVAGHECTGPSHSYSRAGSYSLTAQVTDSNAGAGTYSSVVTVAIPTPVVGTISAPSEVKEGATITASASFTPAGVAGYSCTVDYGDGLGPKPGTIAKSTCAGPSHKYGRAGTFTITIQVKDPAGAVGSASTTITVDNVTPTVSSFTVTPAAVKIGTCAKASLTFVDPGTTESYDVIFDWGDGTSTTLKLGSSVRSASSSHVYKKAGLYTVGLMLSDGAVVEWPASTEVAVYDPARTLSGSGAVTPPADWCQPLVKCPYTETISVTAKYASGATKPTVSLTYTQASFKFVATGANWFTGSSGVAWIDGTGKVNGVSGYRFRLGYFAGQPDSLQFQVWSSTGELVYNGGGSLKPGEIKLK